MPFKKLFPQLFPIIAVLCYIIAVSDQFFIQDDWYHIFQTQDKTFLQVLPYFKIWGGNILDPLNFYRPLSTKLYFYIAYRIFKLNHFYYLLANSALFLVNVWLFSKLSRLIADKKTAFWAIFIYSFSLSHFTLFSYITKAEDLLFGAFAFASLYSFAKNKPKSGSLFFLLSLACRESAMAIPLWLFFFFLFFKKLSFKKTISKLFLPFMILSSYIFLRTAFYGWPKDNQVYILHFGFNIFSNLIKYLQWSLNLTGLVSENSSQAWLYRLIALIFFISLTSGLLVILKKKGGLKKISWGVVWWLIFLSPVLFFSKHRDPWNLIVAVGGLATSLALMVKSLNISWQRVFFISYLTLFFAGLWFYRNNHWTVLRSRLVNKTKAQVISQCKQKTIIFRNNNNFDKNELRYSWYYDLGIKIICKNADIKIQYD